MEREEVLNIFYNEIMIEASKGRVDCYFFYNIIFHTRILDDYIEANSSVEDLIIPTLEIKNKEEFDNLLIEYVNRALQFYDDSCFYKDAISNGVSKEKIIMTLLWSNATWEDYANPCDFLRRRIQFFDDYGFNRQFVSKSHLLSDSYVILRINKNRLESETPYSLDILLSNDLEGSDVYQFPRVYFGISQDTVYIYAMQNVKNAMNNRSSYQKKINRLLYKVNDGVDVYNETYEKYDVGNLKDVTHSFLMASNIALGFFHKMGFHKVKVSSFLISRWNSKRIANDYDIKYDISREGPSQLEIQKNLTEKFIRTFNRLAYHHEGVNIYNSIAEDSSYLMLYLDDKDVCNNSLLDETYNLDYGLENSKGYGRR